MDKQAKNDGRLVITFGLIILLMALYTAYAANTGTVTVGATVSGVMIGPADGPSTLSPTEGLTTTLEYSFYIEDPQGVGNIDDASAASNVSLGGTKYLAVCTPDIDINATARNYSCSVNMNYYDNATTWTYIVEGGNYNLSTMNNQAATFAYSLANLINVSKTDGSTNLNTWASVWFDGATDILSAGNPILISQRGNAYSTSLGVTAVGLTSSTTADYIPSEDFTINVANSCNGPDALTNGTETGITNAYLQNSAPNTEELYLCMEEVPSVAAATYAAPENWIVTVNSP